MSLTTTDGVEVKTGDKVFDWSGDVWEVQDERLIRVWRPDSGGVGCSYRYPLSDQRVFFATKLGLARWIVRDHRSTIADYLQAIEEKEREINILQGLPISYKGYDARTWTDEEGRIRGEVTNKPKSMITFYGKDEAEAEEAFRDSVDDFLTFAEALGLTD